MHCPILNRFYGGNAWDRSVAYPTVIFYDENERCGFYKLICDRSVSCIIQAFDRRDSEDVMVETCSLDELRAAMTSSIRCVCLKQLK
jgi:hypothetical protein